MYFWNIEALGKTLAADELDEKDEMFYFLASTLIFTFNHYYALWWGAHVNWLFYFEALVISLIAIYAINRAYIANGGESGRDFIKRAIILGVPIGVRVGLYAIVFGLLLYNFAYQIFPATMFADPQRAYLLVSYAGLVGLTIYYWWLLVNAIERIANAKRGA